MAKVDRDLLGKRIRQKRSKYEVGLEQFDNATRTERAERLRWIDEALPRDTIIAAPYETILVFREAKDCYIAGHLTAALVLAAAYLEHWMAAFIASKGYVAESKRGLAGCVECARANDLVPAALLDKLDRIRVIRNPFVHPKDAGHPHLLSTRMLDERTATEELLDQDARGALTLMFAIGDVFAKIK